MCYSLLKWSDFKRPQLSSVVAFYRLNAQFPQQAANSNLFLHLPLDKPQVTQVGGELIGGGVNADPFIAKTDFIPGMIVKSIFMVGYTRDDSSRYG